MAAFRIFDPFTVFWDDQGRILSGGEIRFYESETTTPKSVFGDPALTIDNGSTVMIGSDGRAEVQIWGDGNYRTRLYRPDGTLVPGGEADNVQAAGGDGLTLPPPVDGEFVTSNGSLFLMAPILQLPDPTGQDGKVPTATGSGYTLQAPAVPPTPVEPDIEVTSTTLRAADGTTSFLMQRGSGTAPASGLNTTNTAITFAIAFADAPHIIITPTVAAAGADGFLPVPSVPSKSATGCTVYFDTNGDKFGKITNQITFDYVAVGTIATPVAP